MRIDLWFSGTKDHFASLRCEVRPSPNVTKWTFELGAWYQAKGLLRPISCLNTSIFIESDYSFLFKRDDKSNIMNIDCNYYWIGMVLIWVKLGQLVGIFKVPKSSRCSYHFIKYEKASFVKSMSNTSIECYFVSTWCSNWLISYQY